MALVDAIDGARTVGRIAAETADHRRVARLFESLWSYDQVVFDASRSSELDKRASAVNGAAPGEGDVR